MNPPELGPVIEEANRNIVACGRFLALLRIPDVEASTRREIAAFDMLSMIIQAVGQAHRAAPAEVHKLASQGLDLTGVDSQEWCPLCALLAEVTEHDNHDGGH